MTITLKQLRLLGACDEQVKLFRDTFGNSVELTKKVVREHCGKFDVDWIACKVLPVPLYADYESKRAMLYAVYESKRDTLYADYKTKRAMVFFSIIKENNL